MIQIREMQVRDTNAVAEIERQIFSQPWSRQGFLDAVNLGNTVFLVAEENNRIIGYIGMYLAMARVAHREGYPEIGLYYEKAAYEEAEHAAKFAELLGDCVWDTKTNLEKRMNAESGACADKKRIATRAKALNLDAIHDTVHEMAKDEARHGKGFEGLYNRYFKK